MHYSTFYALMAAALPTAFAQQSVWGQCGGTGWSGATTCSSGNTCVVLNPYYSQCQPGAAPTTAASTTLIPPTTRPSPTSSCTSTVTVSSKTTTAPTKTTGGAAPSAGAGPGSTLQSGYSWIRAVAAPNFHKYLQSATKNAPDVATLDNNTSAGQFAVQDGQLVELVSSSASNPSLLYANVGQPASPSGTVLPVTFSTTKNDFGTFSFSGDSLQWSAPSIKRPNLSAWYVCEDQQVFINTGQYLYGTPSGCADQTIHSYGNSVADV